MYFKKYIKNYEDLMFKLQKEWVNICNQQIY